MGGRNRGRKERKIEGERVGRWGNGKEIRVQNGIGRDRSNKGVEDRGRLREEQEVRGNRGERGWDRRGTCS